MYRNVIVTILVTICLNVVNDYFYLEAPPPSILEIVPPGIVYALVFLVGTVGNILVIFVVVHFKNMRNVTNIFLASLSTADLCLIWFCVPIQVIQLRKLF